LTALEFEKLFESIAPKSYAEDWDNVGLLLGRTTKEIKNILCVLDITSDIIIEAIQKDIDLIVCHHPFVFDYLSLVDDNVLGSQLLQIAKNDICVFAAHTNLDNVSGGINDYIVDILGLKDVVPLYDRIAVDRDAKQSIDNLNFGMGRFGVLKKPMAALEYRDFVGKVLGDSFVSLIGKDVNTTLKNIVVINGSGASRDIIDRARQVGATAFVTAEVKHHLAIYAMQQGLIVIEPHHFNMEYVYIDRLVQLLQQLCLKNKFDIKISKSSVECDLRR